MLQPRYKNRSHRIGRWDITWSTALPGVPVEKQRVDINVWGGSYHNEATKGKEKLCFGATQWQNAQGVESQIQQVMTRITRIKGV